MADLTMPVITGDADWLDLREGERGSVRGRMHTTLRPGAAGMLVATCAWELIAIELGQPWSGEEIAAGRSVSVDARRTEDGLSAGAGDITQHEEEQA